VVSSIKRGGGGRVGPIHPQEQKHIHCSVFVEEQNLPICIEGERKEWESHVLSCVPRRVKRGGGLLYVGDMCRHTLHQEWGRKANSPIDSRSFSPHQKRGNTFFRIGRGKNTSTPEGQGGVNVSVVGVERKGKKRDPTYAPGSQRLSKKRGEFDLSLPGGHILCSITTGKRKEENFV